MLEETIQVAEQSFDFGSSEFVSAIIGAVVGAAAGFIGTVYLDRKKDIAKKEGVKAIILADIETQIDVLKKIGHDLFELKNHLNGPNALSDTYFGKHDAYSDNVYKSNTMLDYHAAFGKDLFVNFQSLYETVIIFKMKPASVIWIDYHKRFDLIRTDEKYKEHRQKVIEINKKDFIAIIGVQLLECERLLKGLSEIKPKIEELEFSFFGEHLQIKQAKSHYY